MENIDTQIIDDSIVVNDSIIVNDSQIEPTKIDECQELKNIKYKTMLLNGAPLKETKSSNNLLNLETFLMNEMKKNNDENWCKLNKTIKTQKLIKYADIYKKDNNLNEDETTLLILFLKDCIDKKKLLKVKDVIYDKDEGVIKEIPALTYIKASKHFTLKNIEKRVSTLKSLAVKKNQSTIKNKFGKVELEEYQEE
jgi:hypothetical protein